MAILLVTLWPPLLQKLPVLLWMLQVSWCHGYLGYKSYHCTFATMFTGVTSVYFLLWLHECT